MPNVDVGKNAALISPMFGSPTAYTLNTGNPLTPILAPGYMLGEGTVISGGTGGGSTIDLPGIKTQGQTVNQVDFR